MWIAPLGGCRVKPLVHLSIAFRVTFGEGTYCNAVSHLSPTTILLSLPTPLPSPLPTATGWHSIRHSWANIWRTFWFVASRLALHLPFTGNYERTIALGDLLHNVWLPHFWVGSPLGSNITAVEREREKERDSIAVVVALTAVPQCVWVITARQAVAERGRGGRGRSG